MKSLGLDVGPTSVGWALVDTTQTRIVACGVRVFPEGVDRDTSGGEQSKSQTRRTARAARRQIRRRARRKRRLRRQLIDAGLLPADPAEQEQVIARNPYPLRARGVHERLTLHELGRVILHLNQRRGFLSNRKTDRKSSETKGILAEIKELAAQLQGRTLGQYLAEALDRHRPATAREDDRVRRRHTRRDMYEHEFDTIWNLQQKYHEGVLTDELREALRGTIFFQRRMYWPKSVVGRCDLEPGQKRCHRAHRDAQRFRILQEVNNLRYLDRETGEEQSLDTQQRATLIAYLAEARSRSFADIRKKLDLPDSVTFNFERADRTKLKGNETDATLSSAKVLGRKAWRAMSEQQKNLIVEVLLEEDREDEALRRLTGECGLTREQAECALAVHLPDGRSNYSLVAIRKLLPHLERGLLLMANDESDSALHAAGYLRPDQRVVRPRTFLPPAPDLPNPIVRQALVEVRKVVNAVIREHGMPDRIHVELAREAKKSFEQRREIRSENKKRRDAREAAAEEIRQIGHKPTRNAVNRVLLWNEQGHDCPYCGNIIGFAQLFSGEADVDHILPRWRSLDDSMANKVVCHRTCNQEKNQQTPREWLEHSDPERYERMLQTIRRLPYNKQRRFQQRDIKLDDFVERQMRDTAYISRRLVEYLKCLGSKTIIVRGQMTADLRHWWGLNNILDAEGRGRKMRNDHRHHAVDAIVIALTDEKRLFALANARGQNMPPPWEGFLEDARSRVLNINVSQRSQRRLAGALHEATFYGPTDKPHRGGQHEHRPWAKDWTEQPGTYVRRKPVTDLTNTKHLAKVRDSAIRKILCDHLRARGVNPDAPGSIPKDAFKGENTPSMPSGVPIRRVRMTESSDTFRRVSDRRSYQYVKPGNNHHIVYRANGDGKDETWSAEVVTMWDAAKRGRCGQPLVDTSDTADGRFVMSLSIGEMFEMDGDADDRLLCVVRKIDQRSRRMHYRLHTDAREAGEINKDNLYLTPRGMQLRRAAKVTVDPLGRIRRAGD